MRSANCRPSAAGFSALPDRLSRSSREPSGSATNPRSVIRSALELGVGRDRRLTAAARDARRMRAPRPSPCASQDPRAPATNGDVCASLLPAFDSDHALGHRRQANLRIEARRDARFQSQANQSGARENDGVHALARSCAGQCCRAASSLRAACPHCRAATNAQDPAASARICAWRRRLEVPTTAPARQVFEPRDARVVVTNASRGSARFSTAPMMSPSEKIRRHVFHRMHGDVGAHARSSRDLEFLDEQTLAADGSQVRS